MPRRHVPVNERGHGWVGPRPNVLLHDRTSAQRAMRIAKPRFGRRGLRRLPPGTRRGTSAGVRQETVHRPHRALSLLTAVARGGHGRGLPALGWPSDASPCAVRRPVPHMFQSRMRGAQSLWPVPFSCLAGPLLQSLPRFTPQMVPAPPKNMYIDFPRSQRGWTESHESPASPLPRAVWADVRKWSVPLLKGWVSSVYPLLMAELRCSDLPAHLAYPALVGLVERKI